MNLTKSQKKFIKKNLKKLSLPEIAQKLGIAEDSLNDYLKSTLPKEKYKRFLQSRQEKTIFFQKQNPFFDFKTWVKDNSPFFLLLATLAVLVYANSINNEFLSDDIAGILKDKNMGNFGFYFRHNTINFFRYFFYCIVFHLFGMKPAFFRLINILLHMGSVLSIYTIVFFFFGKKFLAFTAASLFAVHPLVAEAVTWISGGIHAQYTFFTLLSFTLYLAAKSKNWSKKYYLLSLGSFLVALFTTEKSTILPLLLLLYELTCGKFKENFKRLLPYFILGGAVAFTVLAGGPLGQRVNALRTNYYQEGGLYHPLTQIPVAISHYLWLTVWPDKLTLYHSEMIFPPGQYLLMGSVTLCFLGLFVFLYFNRKYRHYSFWFGFFIISLLPMLTPFKVAWIVAERYVYLGSIGIFVIIALIIEKIGQITKNQKVSFAVLTIILLLLSTRTIIRNIDWKNQDNLWLAAARTSPSSPQNHNNLGDLYARRGNFEKAAKEFQTAILLKPDYGDAFHNLANVYRQMGKNDLAEENYKKALSFNPAIWQSYQNLSVIFFEQRKNKDSLEMVEKAIELNPQNPDLYIISGVNYLQLKDKQKAREALQKALELDPNNQKAKEMLSTVK